MSPFLLGVSSSSRNRVLGGTYIYANGESSGFFIFRTKPHVQFPKLTLINHSRRLKNGFRRKRLSVPVPRNETVYR